MKRFILIILTIIPISVYAQDKIKTLDGKTIEAKILEIDDEVVYKEYNYQNGPTYRIKTDEIVSIILENGTVKSYMSIPEGITYPSSISIKKGDVYGDGRELSDETLPYILGKDLYRSYRTGSTLRKISTPLLIAGGPAIAAGVFFMAIPSLASDSTDESTRVLMTTGYFLIGAGIGSFLTAIPLRIISKSKFNSVVDDYNHKPHAQLTMGATHNGFGLQLQF